MTSYFNNIRNRFSDFWLTYFWQHPNRLMGLKVMVSAAALIIPFILAGKPIVAGTLALGVLGGAIAETDDHPKGRLKSLSLTLVSFLIASISVEVLRPYPFPFAIGLFCSAFVFIIVGGMSERYRGITFGTLLVSIYTMLGTGFGNPWYYQPLVLSSGALAYGLVSLLLLRQKPWRPLQEQLAIGFNHLSRYIYIKSKFFPSDESSQDYRRNQLAQKNIDLVQAIDSAHKVLRSYAYEIGKNDKKLGQYYRQWLLLQQLHERAASSHEQYDLLSQQTDNIKLVEGIGQLLVEISQSVSRFADSLLNGKRYKTPISMQWTLGALEEMMAHHTSDRQYASLSLLSKNLKQMVQIMEGIHETIPDKVPSDYEPLSRKQRLKALLKPDHPRFRYALRLSICLVVGYALTYFLHIEKGEWILLTSLFVCQQNYISTRQRLTQRILGTLKGVVAGILLIQLLPTLAGNIVLVLLSLYLFFYYTKSDYAKAVIFITTTVIALFNIQLNQGFDVIVPRVVDTLIGAVLAYLSVRFIMPDWQYKNLPQLLSNALMKNNAYFEAVYTHHVHPDEYAAIRQNAHLADTALTTAWRSIQVEPKGGKLFQHQAFRLTYLNHTMLSYISAFAAHNKGKNLEKMDVEACREISEMLREAQQVLSGSDEQPSALHLEDEPTENKVTKTTVLLSNISRFAKELLTEAKKLAKKNA